MKLPGQLSDVLVEPTFKNSFEDFLITENIQFHLKINDVGLLIEENFKENNMKKPRTKSFVSSSNFDYGIYHTLNDIEIWMNSMSNLYPLYVKLVNVSKSYENRTIKALYISVPSSIDKKTIWIDAGIHSCEWIGISTAIYTVNEVVDFFC